MSEFRGSHLDLCRDLAEHLSTQGYRAWVEVRRVGVQSYGDAGRIDVLALTPWTGRTKFSMIAFEIKTQRSDFIRDVNTGKWRRYVTEYGVPSVCFACVKGVAEVADVPTDAGLFIRGEDGWKRSKAPRPLEGDQRKLDPLLLLSMLTDPSYDSVWRRRVARGDRIKVPPSVMQAIKATPNVEYHELLQYSDLGRLIGRDLSRRLGIPPKETESIHKWARTVLEAVAEATSQNVADLQDEAARHGEYHDLKRWISEGLSYHRQRDIVEKLLHGALAVGSDYKHEQPKITKALAVLDALEVAEDEALQIKRRRNRKAS